MLAVLLLQADRSRLEQFLAAPGEDPTFYVTALVAAFVLGAAHALTPGHGKTIVAAYLVGTRGRVADAIFLGGVVTATHTAAVFVLGLATLYASHKISLDRIFPWLSLLSGALVAGIGLYLIYQRAGASVGQGHSHAHAHSHSHSHAHSHGHGDGPSRGSLLTLGISGGLVPCPEALVVLMLAISIQRIAFGLTLLVAFSLGLAAVLITIGIAMVLAGPLFERATGGSRWLERLPLVSAVVVTVVGIVMVAQAARTL